MSVTYIVRTRGDRMAFLKAALESVRGQLFADAQPFIVVDVKPGPDQDRIFDACVELAHEVRIPTFTVKTADGVGMPRGAQMALERVRTPFVSYLDDDDILYSNHAADLVSVLEREPDYGVAYGRVREVRCHPVSNEPEQEVRVLGRPFTVEALKANNQVSLNGTMMRTEVARRAPHLAEDGPLHDWGHLLRLARMGVKFVAVPAFVAEYRVRSNEGANGASRAEMIRWTESVRSRLAQDW